MGSPNSRDALVQHAPFHLEHNFFVRFIRPDEAQENFRAVQGFRRGWLMFLGIPPDYRNDYDIANAVSTFGKFHFWNNEDPIKCRALVYASFPSPSLVPRGVVFGKYAAVGGVRCSWTAALYILSADFVEVLPADEDQMPPDGNPHPLPGHLLHNMNLFVGPQFPEIGWDWMQNNDDIHNDNVQQNVEHEDDQMVDDQESMILNPSEDSDSSVHIHQGIENNLLLQVGMVRTAFFGPQLPPSLQWKRLFECMLPQLLVKNVPVSLLLSPFGLLANMSSEGNLMVEVNQCGRSCSAVSSLLSNAGSGQRQRPVARALSFDNLDAEGEVSLGPLDRMDSPVSRPKKRGRPKKSEARVTVVQSGDRRFTRSSLKLDGFRPKPVIEKASAKKKFPRAKSLLYDCAVEIETQKQNSSNERFSDRKRIQTPETPIPVMQRVGKELGISPDKLTKERLEADPSSSEANASDD
jgi:hypothetical protein